MTNTRRESAQDTGSNPVEAANPRINERSRKLDPWVECRMSYRKAILVGTGVGLLLAIAVATIDNIRLARLASSLPSCPAPRCTRLTEIVSAEPLHVLMAFALGFAAVSAWFLRRHSERPRGR